MPKRFVVRDLIDALINLSVLASAVALVSAADERSSNDFNASSASRVALEAALREHQSSLNPHHGSDWSSESGRFRELFEKDAYYRERARGEMDDPSENFRGSIGDYFRKSRGGIIDPYENGRGEIGSPVTASHLANEPLDNSRHVVEALTGGLHFPPEVGDEGHCENWTPCSARAGSSRLRPTTGGSPSGSRCEPKFLWRTGDSGSGRTVCRGVTLKGSNVSLLQHMAECEVIHGNLAIAHVGNAVGADWPTLSLRRLREITGFLLVRNIHGLASLSTLFPSLSVIRGRELLGDHALVVTDTELEDVGLVSLQSIMRGSVYVAGNDDLDSLDGLSLDALHRLDPDAAGRDWIQSPRRRRGVHSQLSNCPVGCGPPQRDPPQSEPPQPDSGHCWSPQHCQIVCPECSGGCRLRPPHNKAPSSPLGVPQNKDNVNATADVGMSYTCCPSHCVGGCYDDGGRVRCNACRELLKHNACVSACSAGFVEYDGLFCVRENTCVNDNCRQTLVTARGRSSCVTTCPPDHELDPTSAACINCSGDPDACERTCPGGVVDSMAAAHSYRGCSCIEGHLIISMTHERDVMHVLSTALSRLSYVRDYVAIHNTRTVRSLHVLPRLRMIGGCTLYRGKYALVAHDNAALEELWPDTRRLQVLKGSVLMYNNPRLCAAAIRGFCDASAVAVSPEGGLLGDLNGHSRVCSERIEGLEVTPSDEGGATLSFRHRPSFDSMRVLGFFAHLRPVTSTAPCHAVVERAGYTSLYLDRRDNVANQGLQFTLRGVLKPYTEYAFYVETYDLSGPTMQSDVVCVRSLAAAPGPPSDLRVAQRGLASLGVVWNPPVVTNGVVDFYVLSYRQLTLAEPELEDDVCSSSKTPQGVSDVEENELHLHTEKILCDFERKPKKHTDTENMEQDSASSNETDEVSGFDDENSRISSNSEERNEMRQDTIDRGDVSREVLDSISFRRQNIADSLESEVWPPQRRSLDCGLMVNSADAYSPPPPFSVAATDDDIESYLFRRGKDRNLDLLARLGNNTLAKGPAHVGRRGVEGHASHQYQNRVRELPVNGRPLEQPQQEQRPQQQHEQQRPQQQHEQQRPQQQHEQELQSRVSTTAPVDAKDCPNSTSTLRVVVRGTARRHHLQRLERFTPYLVQINACNFQYPWCTFSSLNTSEDSFLDDDSSSCPYLCSPAAIARVFYTLPDVAADRVTNLATEVRDGAVAARWRPPASPNGHVLAYVVRLVRDNVTVYHECTGPQQEFVSPVLAAPGHYVVRVTALTSAGGAAVSSLALVQESGGVWAGAAALVGVGVLVGTAGCAVCLACVWGRLRRALVAASKASSPEKVPPHAASGEPDASAAPVPWLRDIDPTFIHRRDLLRVEETHIGRGNYGVVRRGELELPCGAVLDVAVKQLKEACLGDPDILHEAKIMLSLRSNHVVRTYGVVVTEAPAVLLVLELMQGGSLLDYLHSLLVPREDALTRMEYKEVLAIALQVADGMLYLSHKKIVHRDLAARNCLLDHQRYVKISDFGLSRPLRAGECDHYQVSNKNRKVPVRSMPPEFFEYGIYSSQSDVWSFGVLLWEVLTGGAVPYKSLKDFEVEPRVRSGLTLSEWLPRSCPRDMKEFLSSCWHFAPLQRPKFNEIIAFLIDELSDSHPHFMERFRRKSFYHAHQWSSLESVRELDPVDRMSPTMRPPAPRIPLPPVPCGPSPIVVPVPRSSHADQPIAQICSSSIASPLNRPTLLPLIQSISNQSYGFNSYSPTDLLSPTSTVSTVLSPDTSLPPRTFPTPDDKNFVVEKVKRNFGALMSIVSTHGKIYRNISKVKDVNFKSVPISDRLPPSFRGLESCIEDNCGLPANCGGADIAVKTAKTSFDPEYEDMRNPNYLPSTELHIVEHEEYEDFLLAQPRGLSLDTRLHISESNLCDDVDQDCNSMPRKHGTVDGSFLSGQSLRNAWKSIFRKDSADSSPFLDDVQKSGSNGEVLPVVISDSPFLTKYLRREETNEIPSEKSKRHLNYINRPIPNLATMKAGAVAASLDECSWRPKSFPTNPANFSHINLNESKPFAMHSFKAPPWASRGLYSLEKSPSVGMTSDHGVMRANSDDVVLRGHLGNVSMDGNADDTVDIADHSQTDDIYSVGDPVLAEDEHGLPLELHGFETPPPSRNNSMGSNQTPTSHNFLSMPHMSPVDCTADVGSPELIEGT